MPPEAERGRDPAGPVRAAPPGSPGGGSGGPRSPDGSCAGSHDGKDELEATTAPDSGSFEGSAEAEERKDDLEAASQGYTEPRVLLEEDGAAQLYLVGEAVERLLARKPRRVPSKAPTVLFGHRNPERLFVFGRWFGQLRAPVVLLESSVEQVTQYLRDDPLGPFADLERYPPTSPIDPNGSWARWGFDEDKREQLFKADWHSVPHLGHRSGLFVPRRAEWRTVMRAPPRIAAFVMAFRAVNQPCWTGIVDALVGLRRAREQENAEYLEEGRGRLLGTLIECFRNQRHFGIIEAQVRFGEAPLRQPSHRDGATSLLHLGLTLGGRRTLRCGVFLTPDCRGNAPAEGAVVDGEDPMGESNVWNEKVWKAEHLVEAQLRPGSAYLSSPFCFEHAVEYEGCSARRPMIALMCRWGFPEDLGKHVNEMRTEDMLDVVQVVANCLKVACCEGQLRLPSLDEVKQGEARLRRLDAEEEARAQQLREARLERAKTRVPMAYG